MATEKGTNTLVVEKQNQEVESDESCNTDDQKTCDLREVRRELKMQKSQEALDAFSSESSDEFEKNNALMSAEEKQDLDPEEDWEDELDSDGWTDDETQFFNYREKRFGEESSDVEIEEEKEKAKQKMALVLDESSLEKKVASINKISSEFRPLG